MTRSQESELGFLWSGVWGSYFDYKDHIVLLLCGKCQTVDLCNNRERKASHISVRVRDILEYRTFKILLRTGKAKRSASSKNDDSWTTYIYEFLFLCQRPDALWVRELSWKFGLSTSGSPVDSQLRQVVCLKIWEFYNEAEQLQFSLQSGNERLCVSCHPVLIWALMYFINKGLLSSLTVVTPWFQCRMHAGRGYTINNQLAAITPF